MPKWHLPKTKQNSSNLWRKKRTVWKPDYFWWKVQKVCLNSLILILKLIFILTTDEFFEKYGEQIRDRSKEFEIVKQDKIEKVGTLETNDSALAVVKQKSNIAPETKNTGVILALDEIKDPGNLGTIVRIADWYGVKNIIASKNTVDFYNPKVIAASKGSFTRVNMFYTDLAEFLPQAKLPVLGAYMDGVDVHQIKFPANGILLMGNESNGMFKRIRKISNTDKITISAYGGAESLNVAIATAVILDNWKK